MVDLSLPGVLALLLAAFFLFGAGANAIGPAQIRADYARWRYPGWFRFVTAALELATAVLLSQPELRSFGLMIGAVVMIGALFTLLWHREYRHAIAPAVVLALLLILWALL